MARRSLAMFVCAVLAAALFVPASVRAADDVNKTYDQMVSRAIEFLALSLIHIMELECDCSSACGCA